MTEPKYRGFADIAPGSMRNLRAVTPPSLLPEHHSTAVPEYQTTEVPESSQLPEFKKQSESITEVPDYRSTSVPEYRGTAVPETKYYKKANEAADNLDRHLTPAESKVFEQIVRLTVGFQRDERQVRVSVLQERTGYGSDKTVRAALKGLERKGVIARTGRPNNSGGITYRILSYSGTAVPEYSGTAAESTPVPRVEITGELKTDLKEQKLDDEAFAPALALFRRANREVTGREPSAADAQRWVELAEVLITELKIAAGRTHVSSVPAFLAEHLRRRLWKIDKGSPLLTSSNASVGAVEAGKRASGGAPGHKIDASQCPDCHGTLLYYPEGFDKGVARCRHETLNVSASDQENKA